MKSVFYFILYCLFSCQNIVASNILYPYADDPKIGGLRKRHDNGNSYDIILNNLHESLVEEKSLDDKKNRLIKAAVSGNKKFLECFESGDLKPFRSEASRLIKRKDPLGFLFGGMRYYCDIKIGGLSSKNVKMARQNYTLAMHYSEKGSPIYQVSFIYSEKCKAELEEIPQRNSRFPK